MRKFGLILAASTMLAPVGAMASSTALHLNSYCDVLNFTITAPAAAEVENSSSCTANIMGGFEVKIPGVKGKWVFVGGPRFQSGTNAWGWLVQSPFKTGKTAYLYESTDGVNYSEIASSTYTVNAPGGNTKGLPPAGKGQSDIRDPNMPRTLHF